MMDGIVDGSGAVNGDTDSMVMNLPMLCFSQVDDELQWCALVHPSHSSMVIPRDRDYLPAILLKTSYIFERPSISAAQPHSFDADAIPHRHVIYLPDV